MDWNTQIKDYWEHWASQAPTPHAEELSLSQFADNLGLSADAMMEALREQGVDVQDSEATIGQIAEANGASPADIYAIIKKYFPEVGEEGSGRGAGKGAGPRKGKGGGVGRGDGR